MNKGELIKVTADKTEEKAGKIMYQVYAERGLELKLEYDRQKAQSESTNTEE